MGLVPIASYILISVIIVSPNLKHFPLLYCYLFSVFSCHSLFPSLPTFSHFSPFFSPFPPPAPSTHSLSLSSLSSNLFPLSPQYQSAPFKPCDRSGDCHKTTPYSCHSSAVLWLLPPSSVMVYTLHNTHTCISSIKKLQVGRYNCTIKYA